MPDARYFAHVGDAVKMPAVIRLAHFFLLAIAMASPIGTLNAEPHDCGSFSLQRKMVGSVVIGSNPPQIGDRRLNRWEYFDDTGEVVGERYIESTVVGLDEVEGDPLIVDVISVFANGTIISRGFAHVPNAHATFVTHKDPAHFAIVGGTGDFARATGTVSAVPIGDGLYRADYDMECPD
ncbi:MAG: hypothetical protein AAGF94_09595 [Pseudomonadota bacterium]